MSEHPFNFKDELLYHGGCANFARDVSWEWDNLTDIVACRGKIHLKMCILLTGMDEIMRGLLL